MNKGIKRGSDVKQGGPAKSSRSQSKAPCQIWPRLSQKEQGVVDARHNFCVILTELLRLDIIGIKNMTDATDVHRLQLTAHNSEVLPHRPQRSGRDLGNGLGGAQSGAHGDLP